MPAPLRAYNGPAMNARSCRRRTTAHWPSGISTALRVLHLPAVRTPASAPRLLHASDMLPAEHGIRYFGLLASNLDQRARTKGINLRVRIFFFDGLNLERLLSFRDGCSIAGVLQPLRDCAAVVPHSHCLYYVQQNISCKGAAPTVVSLRGEGAVNQWRGDLVDSAAFVGQASS